MATAKAADELYRDREEAGRVLTIPSSNLREIQRRLYRRVLRRLTYHDAAYCVKGRGIVQAVTVHTARPYLLHLDISRFFPSVTHEEVRGWFARMGTPNSTLGTLVRLVTYKGALPQGAPTSVAVANGVAERLDESLTGLVEKHRPLGLAYTRYVDDIAISGGEVVKRLENTARRIVEDCGWTLNEKGGLLGPSDRHRLLGLIAGLTPNVDNTYLAGLRWMVGQVEKGRVTDPAHLDRLSGQIAFVVGVDERKGRPLQTRLRASLGRD